MIVVKEPSLAEYILKKISDLAHQLDISLSQDEPLWQVLPGMFTLSVSDPRYRSNALAPGALPFEVSFSEQAPLALRFDLEPYAGQISPEERRIRVAALAETLSLAYFGPGVAMRFAEAMTAYAWGKAHPQARFGAFMGVEYGASGHLQSLKVYFESDGNDGGEEGTIPEALSTVAERLPRFKLHFISLACHQNVITKRVYLLSPAELRLLEFYPLLQKWGMGHWMPQLAETITQLGGNLLNLPPASLMIGLSQQNNGLELKLELVCRDLLLTPAQLHKHLMWHFNQRESRSAYQRWQVALRNGGLGNVLLNVISIRVSAAQPPLVSVYLAAKEV